VNPLMIKARTLARKMKVIYLINRLRPKAQYEEKFHQELEAEIKPGDVVWDIGANVGLYTEQFCEWVGPQGSVVAFEPGAASCDAIRQRLPECPQLTIENVALAENDSVGQLIIREDYSVSNHIQMDQEEIGEHQVTAPVVIARADTVATRLGRTPHIVKIDVEGFEEIVLSGFGDLLLAPGLRSLFIEVHFAELEQRGWKMAPVRIEKLLKSKGFSVRWPDASHLVAQRVGSIVQQ
jgi:FkbM family methyltransferase